MEQDYIQNSLNLLFTFGKVWGFFPLKNLSDKQKICFKVKSWNFIYSFLIWILLFYILLMAIYSLVLTDKRFLIYAFGTNN